jgi:hypothetical protein
MLPDEGVPTVSSPDVLPIGHFAEQVGLRRQTISDLVRALKIPTHKVPGLIAAKGLDAEGRARIRRALNMDSAERATA